MLYTSKLFNIYVEKLTGEDLEEAKDVVGRDKKNTSEYSEVHPFHHGILQRFHAVFSHYLQSKASLLVF